MKDMILVPCYDIQDPIEKKRKTMNDTGMEEEEILKAWKRGERTIDEIIAITGYSRKTVMKYIPEGING